MAHKVRRLSKDILSKPQLITPSKFQEIAEYLESRNASDEATMQRFEKEREDKYGDMVEGNSEYGVVKIYGPLCYRMPTGIEALCGDVASYESIIEQVETLCQDENLQTVVLDVDSPGGSAYTCMSTARKLRTLCDNAGKKLVAYVDGNSCSAAYALTCAAHEVVINPDAEAGSIGVVVRLVNDNEAMKKAGVNVQYIHAGASKIPFDEEGEFRDEFLEDLQKRVDKLYNNFVSHVATMRNIDPQVVRDTEAKVYDAEEALSLGLVDRIMEADDFKKEYLQPKEEHDDNMTRHHSEDSTPVSSSQTINQTKVYSMAEVNTTVDMAAFEAMKQQLAAYQEKEQLAAAQAKKEAITQSLSGATFLSNLDGVVSYLAEADEAHTKMLNSVIADAQASLATQASEFEAKLAAEQEGFAAKLAEAEAAKEELSAKTEAIQAEFAEPEAIRAEEKEENVQQASFQEKLSRKVAAAMATKANM